VADKLAKAANVVTAKIRTAENTCRNRILPRARGAPRVAATLSPILVCSSRPASSLTTTTTTTAVVAQPMDNAPPPPSLAPPPPHAVPQEKVIPRPYKCPYAHCGRAFSRLEHQVSLSLWRSYPHSPFPTPVPRNAQTWAEEPSSTDVLRPPTQFLDSTYPHTHRREAIHVYFPRLREAFLPL
jgi:hypothetical protein